MVQEVRSWRLGQGPHVWVADLPTARTDSIQSVKCFEEHTASLFAQSKSLPAL